MTSQSLLSWKQKRVLSLDEIEDAHQSVGGTERGRRYATQQINQAYAMLLASQFQGFCRDLHSECVDLIVDAVAPAALQTVLRGEFILHRKLDKGNPNRGNIGSDFNRLGVNFWPDVEADDARNANRMELLDELNVWRNAIAHQDFDPTQLGGQQTLRLARVRVWRKACAALAESFDHVMYAHIRLLIGAAPW